MNNVYKGKAKTILALVTVLLLITAAFASGGTHFSSNHPIHPIADTLPPSSSKSLRRNKKQLIKNTDSSEKKNAADSLKPKVDTFAISGIKLSKDSLEAPIAYHADDSMVLDVPGKKIYLYGKKTETKYKDQDLTAPGIVFDQGNNLISASYKKDSAGRVIAFPTFTQGESKTISDSMKFNMKTGKGITKGTYTKQGEMYVYGETIKKVTPDIFYAYKARFTTCDLDTPHFAFVSNKIKFINKKFAITGPVHPEFEGVPLPIYLPFGIFPLTQGRHSGFLPPTFSESSQLGLSLNGLGYYKVLSDCWDLIMQGSIYSYGSWTLQATPHYYKRYHYRGSFALSIQSFKQNFKGDPDYSVTRSFNIQWSHAIDTKAYPGVTFSASVNAGSSVYNSQVPNNSTVNFQNQLQSSIQFSKVWKDKPYNISITANHNQNAVTKQINVTLPDISFNLNTQYPFRRKEPTGTLKWYENIGVGLNSNAQSTTSFSDSIGGPKITTQIGDNYKWGATHNVPITLSLPPLGVVQVAPSIGLAQNWYQQKSIYSWDSHLQKLDTSIQKGFYTGTNMSFGVGISTNVYGMMVFGKNSYVQAIRHKMTPSISISYSPNLNGQYYYTTQDDSAGHIGSYSVFQGNIAPPFGPGKFGGLSFSLDNNIEMKVLNKDKKDTSGALTKKVSLLDHLNIGGSYNFLADSFQLSDLSLSAGTSLFNNKLSITAGASVDPYQVGTNGEDINKLVWNKKILTLGRLTSANLSLSSQFRGGDSKNTKSTSTANQNLLNPPVNSLTGLPLDEEQTELTYMNTNAAMNADFAIPWTIGYSYSLLYFKVFDLATNSFQSTTSQSVNWNATLGLTEKWQVGLNGSYNISLEQLGLLSLSIARDMHCWQMGINVSPVGTYRYFNITISPKSALLRDVKVNRSRSFENF